MGIRKLIATFGSTISVRLTFLLFCLLVLVGGLFYPRTGAASELPAGVVPVVQQKSGDTTVPLPPVDSGSVSSTVLYLPLVTAKTQLATRFGFGTTGGSVNQFPEIDSLKAGWYLNWGVQLNPQQPNGLEYAQMIRLHQDLTCPVGSVTAHNRTLCPYVVPHSYTYRPDAATIQQVATTRSGSLWMVGNEIERKDWPGGNQDEMLPELYAEAYHHLYNLIKAADPTALVAIGGVIQATPLRMKYLDRVLDHYQATYGVKMPVDVWNIHAFILPEKSGYWGADIPVGLTETSGAYLYHLGSNGEVLSTMPEHIDGNLIAQQIRDFRQWMKDRGEQEKPLIISEYSVLLPNWVIGLAPTDSQPVIDFMLWSFDHFLTAKDCTLGYTADECRLIQRWIWYSLDDTTGFNEHQALFNPITKAITPTGQKAREFVQNHILELAKSPY